jgi:hypothetical protein
MREYLKFSMAALFFAMNACARLLADDGLGALVDLRGAEYVKMRDRLLENDGNISIGDGEEDERLLLLSKILKARKKHPELFKKFAAIIERRYEFYKKQMKMFGDCPGEGGTATSAMHFMMQGGPETKEYITAEVTAESAYMVDVTHTQTDEQVAKAKEINEASRLVVIEYLWKLTRRDIVEYGLLDAFAGIPYMNPPKSFLPVFIDVLKRTKDYRAIGKLIKIFINARYRDAVPVARERLLERFKEKDFRSCSAISRYLRKYGNENDIETIDRLAPKLDAWAKEHAEKQQALAEKQQALLREAKEKEKTK